MKKKTYSLLHFVFLVLIISACASTVSTSGSGDDKKKTAGGAAAQPKAEDLSKYRPKFTAPDPAATRSSAATTSPTRPVNHVNERVDALLDTLASMNKSIRFAKGYRILAYSGTERKSWLDIREAIVRRMPEVRDYAVYNQPNYRLKIGDFYTRVEAHQVLSRIRDITPNAMIIADQINVK